MSEQVLPEAGKAALQYVSRGWHVTPIHSVNNGRCTCKKPDCSSPGKHPCMYDWHRLSTDDPDMVKRMWKKFPLANVGVVTGKKSGLLVIDIDPRNGGNDGLKELERKHGKLPTSNVVKTGGGGLHFYLRYPDKGHIGSSTQVLAPGVDVKGDRGYVVAPPSNHISGNTYRWRVTS